MYKNFSVKYCIEGISETPNASADFYCQSNTNNLTRASCAFYVKSLQVNHRQNTQKEKERVIFRMGRGGERKDRVRGYGVGFYRGQLFLVLTIILNQHKIFWDIATDHICTNFFRDACKYYNRCPTDFLVL